MSNRRELERHRKGMVEIRNILNSMKNLSYLETRRLARFITAQRAVTDNIEQAANDLLEHFPDIAHDVHTDHELYLLIGSERGFCGNFNQNLVKHLQQELASTNSDVAVIAVGSKLHTLLEDDTRVKACIEGASISDEILPVLAQVSDKLIELQASLGTCKVQAISYSSKEEITSQTLLPSFTARDNAPAPKRLPPRLNLPPQQVFIDLVDHYLYAQLHSLMYDSLMAENQKRIGHLDAAVHHLDEDTEDLRRKSNMLRQEEIIEEIEIILLNASRQEFPA